MKFIIVKLSGSGRRLLIPLKSIIFIEQSTATIIRLTDGSFMNVEEQVHTIASMIEALQ